MTFEIDWRENKLRKEKKRRLWNFLTNSLLFALIALGIFALFYFAALAPNSPRQVAKRLIEHAPIIKSSQLREYCDTNKIVKIKLRTQTHLTTPRGRKLAFFKAHAYARGLSAKVLIPNDKIFPTQIALNERNKAVLNVDVDDLNLDYLDKQGGLRSEKDFSNADMSPEIKPAWDLVESYDVYTLPADSDVYVIGTIWRINGYYQLKGIGFYADGQNFKISPIVRLKPTF